MTLALMEPRAGPHKRPVNIHVEATSVDDMQMSAVLVYVRACVARIYARLSARRVVPASTEDGVISLSTIEHRRHARVSLPRIVDSRTRVPSRGDAKFPVHGNR